ncbi:MAG: lysophospholipid acyltransferase family protein [Myxococcales bacterium]|nr:lysophospholipid acyltransferase family protein [Myxococcales bacterium]
MTGLLRLLSWFLGLWPEALVTAVAWALGGVWWHVLRYRRRVMQDNLRQAFPERSEAERARLGRAACTHLVTTLIEVFRIPRYRRRFEQAVRVEDLEHFHAAKAKGKGVLCVSGHLGNWELGVAGVAAAAAPVHLVVKRFGPAMERFMTDLRQGSGLSVIPADGAVRPIMQALRRNEAVVFVLDQNATRSIGVFVDFFGKPACTMSGLAVLAERTGAEVIAAVPWREGPGRHVLTVLPAIPFERQADREETVRHMTQVYTRVIEDAIKARPAQWFWTHKRWRTRPASTPASEAAADG